MDRQMYNWVNKQNEQMDKLMKWLDEQIDVQLCKQKDGQIDKMARWIDRCLVG